MTRPGKISLFLVILQIGKAYQVGNNDFNFINFILGKTLQLLKRKLSIIKKFLSLMLFWTKYDDTCIYADLRKFRSLTHQKCQCGKND